MPLVREGLDAKGRTGRQIDRRRAGAEVVEGKVDLWQHVPSSALVSTEADSRRGPLCEYRLRWQVVVRRDDVREERMRLEAHVRVGVVDRIERRSWIWAALAVDMGLHASAPP